MKKFLSKIFSIKNDYSNIIKRKIIRILGLKMSFSIYKKPYIDNNTFLLWEPTYTYHGEIIPGYAKYLVDLGYKVSILMDEKHKTSGLFDLYNDKNIIINDMTLQETRKYFEKYGLGSKAKGLLITTIRNVNDQDSNYDYNLSIFKQKYMSKIFFIEHDVVQPIDKQFWKDNIITLAPINYKEQKSVVVNPNYFGEIKSHKKNPIPNFIVIGALEKQRKNFDELFNAVKLINDLNFKVTIIGNGDYSFIPNDIVNHFEIKGRLDFKDMYKCLEKADYILALLDRNNEQHYRYITTGTSGSYQLSYGFNKPLIIDKIFANNRYLNENNAILYDNVLLDGLKKAITLSDEEYELLVETLKKTTNEIRKISIENLYKLIKN